jgi:hypothetical protein
MHFTLEEFVLNGKTTRTLITSWLFPGLLSGCRIVQWLLNTLCSTSYSPTQIKFREPELSGSDSYILTGKNCQDFAKFVVSYFEDHGWLSDTRLLHPFSLAALAKRLQHNIKQEFIALLRLLIMSEEHRNGLTLLDKSSKGTCWEQWDKSTACIATTLAGDALPRKDPPNILKSRASGLTGSFNEDGGWWEPLILAEIYSGLPKRLRLRCHPACALKESCNWHRARPANLIEKQAVYLDGQITQMN